MPENSVDSIVTDPPYGLSFMGKRWDYDVPSVEIWEECLRVLKPGGHLMAFAGTRTQHRMACRIEDAGFEIRDILAWVYGSGFPKSLDVSKALDKAAGVEREVVGLSAHIHSRGVSTAFAKVPGEKEQASAQTAERGNLITAPATDAARQWAGWGTALKPALEPITMARKPLIGTVAANVAAHGTGGLNIDGCRVQSNGEEVPFFDTAGGRKFTLTDAPQSVKQAGTSTAGRWPANLIHDGSDEVVALFPSEAGAAAPVFKRNGDKFRNSYGTFAGDVDEQGSTFQGDKGSAARFFYCAKADREDRNDGCDGMPEGMPRGFGVGDNQVGIQRGSLSKPRSNIHPTVKPTDLMRWLCRLVTPPGGIVLDPFMGSGSTGRGAIAEGFEFIGIEMDPAYLAIAESRIAASVEQRRIDTAQLDMFGERQIA